MSNLRIEPSDHQLHFELSDETPENSVTLGSSDSRPLIFRVSELMSRYGTVMFPRKIIGADINPRGVSQIQPNQKSRYAIWPSVGVVEPGDSAIVSVVLLERARSNLEIELEPGRTKLEKTDRIVVEWCRAPDAVYRRLGRMGDADQDFEILSSFWNTKGYEFGAPVISAKQPLGVHFRKELSMPTFIANKQAHMDLVPIISAETSSVQEDPSICGDSLMLSVSTWDGESQKLPAVQRRLSREPPQYSGPISPTKGPVIHKYQLQQTLRCSGCYQLFNRDPDQFTIPVMSQACGHTVCRGCVVRKADEDYEFAKEYQSTVSCPLCLVSHAFSQELHINHSLCAVIALVDSS